MVQIMVPAETTEVTCVRELLKDQPLVGITVTADAAPILDDTAFYPGLVRSRGVRRADRLGGVCRVLVVRFAA